MEQDRFDELAKKVFDGSSRRRVIGGALATVVGAGIAAVTGADAKNAKGKGKSKKGRVRKEAVCAPGDCPPNTCCSNTPAGNDVSCTPLLGLQGTGTCFAPDGGGGFTCTTCPTGTSCDVLTGRCVCSPVSCANGCCIDNSGIPGADDQCIANGSGAPVSSPNGFYDGSFVCGTAGSFCNVCSVGTVFAGCCSSTGFCSAGTSNTNCGSSGELCETCINDSECGIDQACTGGTTTTTTAAPTTTTLAPCGTTKNGKPKVRCGTGATSVCCKKCNGANTGCKKHHHK